MERMIMMIFFVRDTYPKDVFILTVIEPNNMEHFYGLKVNPRTPTKVKQYTNI